MASTGEVGCLGDDYYEAILKAMLSVGYRIPKKNILISSGPMRSKTELIISANYLATNGYQLYATKGTHLFFQENNIPSILVNWPDVKESPNAYEMIRNRQIDLVINIPKDLSEEELDNDYTIRRAAVDFNVPLITNARLASAFIYAISKYKMEDLKIKSWDEY
jgi:carbamoyl-phosphate synthase large subunit